ncbi:hypothetical protein G9A89_007292 [Geosiphon pyriformis]|nr:hypothetical protein G9A89_007292 [Geosiphon pyriformis]
MVSFVTETKLCSSIKLWIADRFDGVHVFTLGLDKEFLGTGVAIIMDSSLAHHVSKVEEISGQVISIWLLFKSKLSVTFLGLYAGVSSGVSGDFNENSSGKSASFKFCLDLGLVNSFVGSRLAGTPTWNNSKGVEKMIDYIFVSGNLLSAVAGHKVASVSDFFNTNHRVMIVSVGLGGLLDVHLNSLHKQANRDCWKFKIKNADCAQWAKFRDILSAKLVLLSELFSGAELYGDVDAMWVVLEEAVVESADAMFLKHWFNKFRCLKNKHFSRFFGLELLMTKIIKVFGSDDLPKVDCLVSRWSTLDDVKAHAFDVLFCLDVKSEVIIKHLSLVCRDYRRSKMFELRLAEEASIKKAIERCIKNFCLDKSSMIKSVLNKPFCKMVLDHLVVDDKLILEPKEVKLDMDKIMKGWTRKCLVLSVLSDFWAHQYVSLKYVWDDAFSGVMCVVNMDELLPVVFSLLDDKVAGLSGILNEL